MTTAAKMVALLTLAANLALCGTAWAGPVWLCAIASAVAVDEDGTVGPPDLDGLARPTFFRVDTDRKEVTLLAPASRRGEVTKIDTIREGKGQWIFSGVEGGRAWSLIITAEGRVTLSLVSDGAVWSVFGHALPETGAPAGEKAER